MNPLQRLVLTVIELALWVPMRLGRFLLQSVMFNPRLGPLRYVTAAGALFLIFAVRAGLCRRADPRLHGPGLPRRGHPLCRRALAGDRHLRQLQRLRRHLRSAPRFQARRELHGRADRTRRLRRQSRPQVDPRARGAGALLALPVLSRGPLYRHLAEPLRHRPARRSEDSRIEHSAHGRARQAEPRRRRLDAANAAGPRHLRHAAKRERRRLRPSCAANSANGGSRPSSMPS